MKDVVRGEEAVGRTAAAVYEREHEPRKLRVRRVREAVRGEVYEAHLPEPCARPRRAARFEVERLEARRLRDEAQYLVRLAPCVGEARDGFTLARHAGLARRTRRIGDLHPAARVGRASLLRLLVMR